MLKGMIEVARSYAARGPEETRQATGQIFGLENGVKAMSGEYKGLMDKELMTKKFREEEDLRAKVRANPEWQKAFGWAWDTVTVTVERERSVAKLTAYRAMRGTLYVFA